MIAPDLSRVLPVYVKAFTARILGHLKLKGQGEPPAVRREKVRQLLRDYPNRFPASGRSINSWLSKNPTRKYGGSEPAPAWRMVDSPYNRSLDALDGGLEILKTFDPEAYRALSIIYLDTEAGDADREYYAKRFGELSPLLNAERRAVGYLTAYLRPIKLAVKFPDDPPVQKKRKRSYRDQFPQMFDRVEELLADEDSKGKTRAMEKTATEFGVSLDTIKRAVGKKKV